MDEKSPMKTSTCFIKKLIVRNRLSGDMSNVKVVYGQSAKSTSVFLYAADWRKVNVETGHLMLDTIPVELPDIPVEKEACVTKDIRFLRGYRGYWQVYFEMDGKRYKINKNNAQVNPWSQDDGKYVEITVRNEGSKVRLDFVMNSGNAYFYAHTY